METENKKEETKNTKWAEAFKKAKNDVESNEISENTEENLKEENEVLKETVLRKTAEIENILKRNKEEIEKSIKYSITNFSKDLLPVYDALSMAIEKAPLNSIEGDEQIKNFFDGVNITFNELKKVLEKNGVKRLFPLKEMFNPELHQAIVHAENEAEEGTIIDVVQCGYTLNNRLLRPAMVVVSKGK